MSASSRGPKKAARETVSPGTTPTGKNAAPTPMVRAAGGAIWRRVPTGVDVVLVHRPAYDDWAFPKGKLEPGETDEQAAVREVREETGLLCRLGTELPSTTYVDGQGRPKLVRYWSMTVVPAPGTAAGSPAASGESNAPLAPEPKARREIDKVYWAAVDEARRRLTYPRDVVVLDALFELLSRSNVGGQKVD